MDKKQLAAIAELFTAVAGIVRAQNPALSADLLKERGLFTLSATQEKDPAAAAPAQAAAAVPAGK